MLCALDMRFHGTPLVYKVKCPCRGLHTLGMSLSAVAQLHCIGVRQITASHGCVYMVLIWHRVCVSNSALGLLYGLGILTIYENLLL